MGIPIGWNIPRDDAKEKDVLRADITGQRSPIRRRLRPSRSPRSQSAFDTDFLVSASRYAPHAEPIARASHARTRLPPPPVPEVSRSAAHRNSESSRDPPSLQREDAGFRRARTTLDRWSELLGGSNAEYEHPLPALTPGFAPASASRIAEEEALQQARQAAPSAFGLPEGVSYHRTSGARLTRSQSPRREWSSSWRGNGADGVEDEHESSENNAVIFHPLRRMGRRNIADGPLPASSLRESWSPATTVDGLGDRERSMSPYDEPLRWEIFHTTVVPDPVAPTAESSFASAAASASFSNSHPSSRAGSSNTSASSSQTHLTVPSRHSASANDQFMRACDTSDSDTTESDTEEEDDRPPHPDRSDRNDRLRNRYGSVILRRRSRPTLFSDEPPHRDSDRYSQFVMERARNASSYVRRFYSPGSGRLRSIRGVASRASRDRENQRESPRMEQLDGTADGPAPASDDEIPPLVSLSSPPLDQELREARSLLERLSRREDVSDDFWASVGLTRSFADRVESFNEREHF